MTLDLPQDAFKLPFPAFVRTACDHLNQFDWTLDDEALFQLIRAVKGHEHTRGMTAEKAYASVMATNRNEPTTLDVGNITLDYEDGEVAFHRLWENVRFPMGADPIEAACGLAGEGLICTQKKRPGRYQRFLTVAALLQIQVRQQPILLPVRKLGQFMPCEPNTAAAWIAWAQADGVLVKTKEHAFRSAGESRAAEYLLGLHCWKAETMRAVGALVGLALRKQDIDWLRQQFRAAENESVASGT